MKQILVGLLLLWVAMPLYAQTENRPPLRTAETLPLPADSAASVPLQAADADSLSLAVPWSLPLTLGGYGLDGCSPFYGGADGSLWRLHEGFNAQLSLSVSTAFGKHAPKGVGFGQTGAFAYVFPLAKNLFVAAGVYASHMDWGRWRQTDAGFAGMLAYRVNENINLYAYGTKSFMPRRNDFLFHRDPFPAFLDRQRDRIGAAAEFKVGRNAMIGVSVECSSY